MWVSVDILHKNNSSWILVLELSMELINQKFSFLARNFVWDFYLHELKFVFLNQALYMVFKVRLDLKNAGLYA